METVADLPVVFVNRNSAINRDLCPEVRHTFKLLYNNRHSINKTDYKLTKKLPTRKSNL